MNNDNIKLINGEALEQLDKMIEEGVKVDCIITDPPYGIINSNMYDTMEYNKNKREDIKWDTTIKPEELFKRLDKVIRVGGRIVLFSQEPYTSEIIYYVNNLYKSAELDFNYRMIWKKDSHGNCLFVNKAPLSYMEDILVFTKKYDYSCNNLLELRNYSKDLFNKINKSYNLKSRKNRNEYGFKTTIEMFIGYNTKQFSLCSEKNYNKLIELYNIDKYDFFISYDKLKEISDIEKEKNKVIFNLEEGKKYKSNILEYKKDYTGFHPTQKPIALMEDLIYTYTNKGDTVLDFTMGSGSTGVAAKNLNRKFIGIEMSEEYFNIANDRINNNKLKKDK